MATKLTLTIAGDEAGVSKTVFVGEDFDEVLERLMPITSPSSQLEHRTAMVYHSVDGRRILLNPNLIGPVEENVDPDE
jgi:hypothetical protein